MDPMEMAGSATAKARADTGPACLAPAKAAADEMPIEVMADLLDGVASNISSNWKAGGSKSAAAGWGFNWNKSSGKRCYQTQVEYGKYRYTSGGCGGSGTYSTWQPRKETGGTDTCTATAPNWTQCANVASGDWYRTRTDGKDYYLEGGVKIKDVIGIDLSSQRAYASSHKMIYNVSGSAKNMCGNNNTPATAGKVQEKKK
ncbi:MAG TPA: hypothetical protein VK545_20965 [Streptomyces sp.]|nr:hypothetical protein [Streptomyces sp.]